MSGMVEETRMPGVNSQTSASELTNYLLLGSDHVRFEPRW